MFERGRVKAGRSGPPDRRYCNYMAEAMAAGLSSPASVAGRP